MNDDLRQLNFASLQINIETVLKGGVWLEADSGPIPLVWLTYLSLFIFLIFSSDN